MDNKQTATKHPGYYGNTSHGSEDISDVTKDNEKTLQMDKNNESKDKSVGAKDKAYVKDNPFLAKDKSVVPKDKSFPSKSSLFAVNDNTSQLEETKFHAKDKFSVKDKNNPIKDKPYDRTDKRFGFKDRDASNKQIGNPESQVQTMQQEENRKHLLHKSAVAMATEQNRDIGNAETVNKTLSSNPRDSKTATEEKLPQLVKKSPKLFPTNTDHTSLSVECNPTVQSVSPSSVSPSQAGSKVPVRKTHRSWGKNRQEGEGREGNFENMDTYIGGSDINRSEAGFDSENLVVNRKGSKRSWIKTNLDDDSNVSTKETESTDSKPERVKTFQKPPQVPRKSWIKPEESISQTVQDNIGQMTSEPHLSPLSSDDLVGNVGEHSLQSKTRVRKLAPPKVPKKSWKVDAKQDTKDLDKAKTLHDSVESNDNVKIGNDAKTNTMFVDDTLDFTKTVDDSKLTADLTQSQMAADFSEKHVQKQEQPLETGIGDLIEIESSSKIDNVTNTDDIMIKTGELTDIGTNSETRIVNMDIEKPTPMSDNKVINIHQSESSHFTDLKTDSEIVPTNYDSTGSQHIDAKSTGDNSLSSEMKIAKLVDMTDNFEDKTGDLIDLQSGSNKDEVETVQVDLKADLISLSDNESLIDTSSMDNDKKTDRKLSSELDWCPEVTLQSEEVIKVLELDKDRNEDTSNDDLDLSSEAILNQFESESLKFRNNATDDSKIRQRKGTDKGKKPKPERVGMIVVAVGVVVAMATVVILRILEHR